MCEVYRKGFIKLLTDNDEVYFGYITAIVESVDEYASIQITNALNNINFRIVASHPKYNMILLEEILKLSNLYKLRLDLSKSIKTTGTLSFNINLAQ
jgi:hypothetical protein